MEIPKIIHQIWSGKDIPNHFKILGSTWKRDYPDWEYLIWDNQEIEKFIIKFYPQYYEMYHQFPYNIQRWDIIRYLILNTIGGMYVDFDYESILPLNELVKDKTCCFAIESEFNDPNTGNKIYICNNALMLSIPEHPFINKVISTVFSDTIRFFNPIPKDKCVLNTTGPMMINKLYYSLNTEQKNEIYLIPSKYVTPFNVKQAIDFRRGYRGQELEDCLEEAFAVHYFFGAWLSTND